MSSDQFLPSFSYYSRYVPLMSASLEGLSSGDNTPHGYALLKNPLTNKGMSFSHEEKLRYGKYRPMSTGLPFSVLIYESATAV